MGSQSTSTLKFFHLPKGEPSLIPGLIGKYRDLRLTGLKSSPSSFSSTFEIEAAFPDSVWESRLLRPGFETFICATIPDITSEDAKFDATADSVQWIAQVTLRGPISYTDFELPSVSGQAAQSSAEAAAEERWQVLSLYVDNDFRGQRIAQRICDASFDWLKRRDPAECEGVENLRRLRLRTMIKFDNTASLTLFERKLGFDVTGRMTLAEALKANGEDVPESVMREYEAGKSTRKGWIYTKVLDKE